ncbi:MAG: GlcG/HbpS family heme-binding protein [Chloroflexota bacterium]
MKLTLEEASKIVDGALAKGREMKLAPLSVVVVDDGGYPKALKREDEATMFRPRIALGKAWGAVAMGASSREIGERMKDRPAFLGALSDLAGGKIVPVAGGLIIRKEGRVVGAVGVSGASSDDDEACAMAGIAAAGLN